MRTRLAIILLVFTAAVPAQQLGTLFLTPKERELLDRQRRGDKVDTAADGQVVVEKREPVVTGYVKRSDGRSTVFLDKRPYRTSNESIQRGLEPRIVERYEEPAPPPAPSPRHRGRVTMRQRGFTLVEIAVVIVVLGFLLAMIAGIATSLIGQQRREITRQRMAGVETALALFVSQNKRLPCPADGRIAGNVAGAGVEALVGGACQTVTGTANSQTHGVVPWQTLGLAEQDMTDGWGSRITYRVAPELVAANSMDFTSCDPGGTGGLVGGVCNAGCLASTFPAGCTPPSSYTATKGLKIRNIASAALIMDPAAVPTSTGAAYVAISHGENRDGAYSNEGTLQSGTPASGTLEAANNAANAAFVNSSSATTAAFVDDFPVYTAGTGHFDDVLLRPAILSVASRAQLGPRAH